MDAIAVVALLALGFCAGAAVRGFVARLEMRAFARHAQYVVRQMAIRTSRPTYQRCPECGTEMLAACTPFVAPGSQN